MTNKPIWQLLQDAARELTREGVVPFTRQDLIGKVRAKRPNIDSNSINPMIQGITDNLKGGAPGAIGKNILHSVGRGEFVLYAEKENFMTDKPVTTAAYMTNKPIWQLLQDAARELTREGVVPFTRQDLIDKVRAKRPDIDSNSINPIIQGITDNLKGGAPGAIGKNILHSVGRGEFILNSERENFMNAKPRSTAAVSEDYEYNPAVRYAAEPQSTAEVSKDFETESDLRDFILERLRKHLSDRNDLKIVPEGKLSYSLPNDPYFQLSHASDILLTSSNSNRKVSIELKYKSAVTDQFKCRAYDTMHMKKHYGEDIYSIMVFAKTKSGISIKQAERISYPFDYFLGFPVNDLGTKVYDELILKINEFMG